MITAVDTSVLFSIAKGEKEAGRWVDLLAKAALEGELVICDVVAAEYSAGIESNDKFVASLQSLGISYSHTPVEAAQLAGRIFRQYRNEGGPRSHVIPDFLVAAHAVIKANRLAAMDRGFVRRYFPNLKIISLK